MNTFGKYGSSIFAQNTDERLKPELAICKQGSGPGKSYPNNPPLSGFFIAHDFFPSSTLPPSGGFFYFRKYMTYQDAFNVVLIITSALGGWFIRIMWSSLVDLRKTDKEIAQKVSSIEVLVAGEYVKRDELDRLGATLFAKLDRIENKLDGKQDK